MVFLSPSVLLEYMLISLKQPFYISKFLISSWKKLLGTFSCSFVHWA